MKLFLYFYNDNIINQSKRKTEFDANFVSTNEVLSKEELGFCLTGNYSLSIADSYKNAIALGGSGSGKSSAVLINSALLMAKGNSSLVINDPSHEIRLKVSGALMEEGYEIKVINYSSLDSECFNP